VNLQRPPIGVRSLRPLAGERLLEAWERASAEVELQRPLALLEVALPGSDSRALAELPLAERDRLLLALHALSFGSALDVFGTCAGCKVGFEFSVPVADLLAAQGAQATQPQISWSEAGCEFALRPVNTGDLLATLERAALEDAQELLLERCLTTSPATGGPLPGSVLEKFEELHAGSELTCAVVCPECGHEEPVDLDIARFLWIEVRRAARRLLGEVHALAAAYGWSEQAILALSVQRRASYLELAAR
jgi:hypothetical protein